MVSVPVFALPKTVKPVPPAAPEVPISSISIVPVPPLALMSRVVKAVPTPKSPTISTLPVPDSKSKLLPPSTVELNVIPPPLLLVSSTESPSKFAAPVILISPLSLPFTTVVIFPLSRTYC